MLPKSLTTKFFSGITAKRDWEEAFSFSWDTAPRLLQQDGRVTLSVRRGSAMKAIFATQDDATNSLSITFTSTPDARKGRKPRGKALLVVKPVERRFTRNALKDKGFRPTPVLDTQPKPKKRPRAKLLLPEPVVA
jgi:hypothetical protein